MTRFPEPLGNLSDIQLQAAFDRFNLGPVIRVEPAAGGNFNQNLFVSTSEGEFVFRGAPHFEWQFPKERFFAKLIHECMSVPAPWPYLYEATSEIFGWPYAIMLRLPGSHVADPRKLAQLTFADREALATAQGVALAKLHAHSFPASGDYDLSSDAIEPFESTYADWVAGEINRLIGATEVLTDRDAEWILSVVLELLPKARAGTANHIVHGDFTYNNMVFTKVGDHWTVSGVFDLMTAVVGDGIADLARQYAMYLETHPTFARVFVKAYCEATEVGLHFAQRFRLFLLHERLLVRDFACRHNADWLDWNIECRAWFQRYLEKIPG